jgi:hypothetical protein
MTTKIEELIKNLVGDMTTHQDILEFLGVVDMKSENVVALSLIPQIKDRIKMLSENVSAYIDVLTNYDKDTNDIDTSKFTYDVMYPDGRIEIGLQAPSREKLISLLDSCTSSEGAQILRVIDSNGKIIESNKPHYVSETFSAVRGGSMESLTSDETKEIVENFVAKSLPKIVDDLNNLCEKKPIPKKKSSKKNKKTKKA